MSNQKTDDPSLNPYCSPKSSPATSKSQARPRLLRTVVPAAVVGGVTTALVVEALERFATFGDSALMVLFFSGQLAGIATSLAIWVLLVNRYALPDVQAKNLVLAIIIAVSSAPIAWFLLMLLFAGLGEVAEFLPEISESFFVVVIAAATSAAYALQLTVGHVVLNWLSFRHVAARR
jgi:hypothetical protein